MIGCSEKATRHVLKCMNCFVWVVSYQKRAVSRGLEQVFDISIFFTGHIRTLSALWFVASGWYLLVTSQL